MKRRLVIVGAGLGGCCLANEMADDWDVTVIELDTVDGALEDRVLDVGRPAVTRPHVGYGLGGTTSFWHNGLIEIDSEIFDRYWPFQKSELIPYYAAAFPKLSGVAFDSVKSASEVLRQKLIENGIPEDLIGNSLFYPRHRFNVWHRFSLRDRVRLVKGEVSDFLMDDSDGVRGVMVRCGCVVQHVEGDTIVLAAGGLGTPALLQRLAQSHPSIALRQVGRYYEDHPTGFVAEVHMDAPIYKLWNFSVSGAKGNLRLPVVIEQDGLQIAFQFRPAAQFGRRGKMDSVLSELRNEPYNLKNYLRLFSHVDDILDILSFRFGLKWPTKRYSLLMVAQQLPDSSLSVEGLSDGRAVSRRWTLPDAYIVSLEMAIRKVIDRLGCAKSAHVFTGWAADLKSSAHHSGTARMHVSAEEGVCNPNAQVYGVNNLFVCDGSLIPASGYANTGLTIAAMALRLAEHLKRCGGCEKNADN
ncbi:MAG: GMC oxidoreductase [Undibacterium sp.]|uniref:GMC oxidoreductase n=1 Tax=Undibacterium sp. TaxID=1914977 RepID=UPI00271E0FDA|nr:GMC oxidoreductase [Undibacterium sp.]MDO8652450.1 GMC oxidoreductase [Undibacterium sp.]